MESVVHTTTSSITKQLAQYTKSSDLGVRSLSLSFRLTKKTPSLIVAASSNNDNFSSKKKREDSHSFAPKPDELFFPEAVLLKEKKDGQLLPDFADEEEKELFEFLNLPLESQIDSENRRHYEVVYMIHEKHDDEVEKVNEKIQDFLKEKKGKVWRFNDWGLRRLAYKIKKAKKAHYFLTNFELEAKWINDLKRLLDQDERVIRHLVIKKDEAETEDVPPPPEFHTVSSGIDSDEEEDDFDYDYDDDDEDWDDEAELDDEALEGGDSSSKSSTVGKSSTSSNRETEKVGS